MDQISQSLLIRRQLELQGRRLSEDQRGAAMAEGIGKCCQVLLVFALCGIEMCVTFEQIYQILFLQYLGVPVNLVSINGAICGGISVILLPALGIMGDRGSNTKLRKMISLLCGMAMFLSGLIILATSGFIKLATNTSLEINHTSYATSIDYSDTEVDYDKVTVTNSSVSILGTDGVGYSSLPTTAFLAIMGFALLDIGFDMSMSLTRAFVLEVVPLTQHTQLLMMATVAQSVAGTTFSSIGCFDFPSILGPIFHVEGVAATLIVFCALLFVIISCGYICTILTGMFITRRKMKYELLRQVPEHLPTGERKATKVRRKLEFNDERRPYNPDILHTEVGVIETKPLLHDNSIKAYSTSSSTFGGLSTSGSLNGVIGDISKNIYTHSSSVGQLNQNSHHQLSSASEAESIQRQCVKKNHGEGKTDAKETIFNEVELSSDVNSKDKRAPRLISAIKRSLSTSLSIVQSPLGEFHSRKLAELQKEKKSFGRQTAGKKMILGRRLLIFCASSFFSIGASLCIVVYSANTLTISIYKGDPTARAGTEGYQRYKEGLRMAAFGNLVMYVTYLIISISNQTIIKIIGEKVQFVLSHCLLITALVVLLEIQTLEVYFIFMIFCGVFRSTVYTLTFVLVSRFHQEQADVEESNRYVGKLMTMVGFLIPSHYMLVSIFMGPLMDLTGNSWAPLMYSLASSAMGLLIFLTLFFVPVPKK